MRQTEHIFRKDFRRLWPLAAAVCVCWAACGAFTVLASSNLSIEKRQMPIGMQRLATILLPLACWFLIANVVYEEPLVGDKQFWLTRPYSRISLLASKLLFLGLFINVPLFLCDCYTLTALGYPVIGNIGWLLLRQILVSVWLVWPAFGIATLTSGFAQLGAAALWLGLGALFCSWLSGFGHRPPIADFVNDSVHRALLLAVLFAIIPWQYRKRKTKAGRITLALLILAAFLPLIPSVTAFELQRIWSQPAIDPAQIGISLDRTRSAGSESGDNNPGAVIVSLPMRVDGLPQSTELKCDAGEVQASGIVGAVECDCPYGDEACWLRMRLPQTAFRQIALQPVDLRVSLFLTLAREREIARVSARRQNFDIPSIGNCRHILLDKVPSAINDSQGFECLTALRGPVAYEWEIRQNGEKKWAGSIPGSSPELPSPITAGLSPVEKWWLPLSGQEQTAAGEKLTFPRWFWQHPDSELVFINPEALAHFRRKLDVPNVRLADYPWRAGSQ